MSGAAPAFFAFFAVFLLVAAGVAAAWARKPSKSPPLAPGEEYRYKSWERGSEKAAEKGAAVGAETAPFLLM